MIAPKNSGLWGVLDGDKISSLFSEFKITWVMGHMVIEWHKDSVLEGFGDRSWKPFRQVNYLPFYVE